MLGLGVGVGLGVAHQVVDVGRLREEPLLHHEHAVDGLVHARRT